MSLYIDNLVSEGLVDLKSLRTQVLPTTVSASTQTLVVTSEHVQSYTGTVAGQIVKLPDATTLTIGYQYLLLNDSTVNVTIQDGAGGALILLQPGQRAIAVCIGTGSVAGTWSIGIMTNTTSGEEQFKVTYPGSGLAVNYTAGNYRQNGVLTAIASGSLTLPGSTTGTIYVDIDGVVKATASIPAGATPLYNFVTSAGAVTSLTDVREDLENNIIWGVVGEMVTVTAGQAKAAGTLEKYARIDHVHGNSLILYKAGTVTAGTFAGNPKKATVTFGTAFGSTAYAIEIKGVDARTWTYESKAVGSFVINANANAALTGEVSWTATATGETT